MLLQVQAGCMYTLQQAQLQALIDSNKEVRVQLMQVLMPNAVNFTCSAKLDHGAKDSKDFFKIGFGFIFGGAAG